MGAFFVGIVINALLYTCLHGLASMIDNANTRENVLGVFMIGQAVGLLWLCVSTGNQDAEIEGIDIVLSALFGALFSQAVLLLCQFGSRNIVMWLLLSLFTATCVLALFTCNLSALKRALYVYAGRC